MKREYKRYDNYNEKEVTEIIEDLSEVVLDDSFISLIPIYDKD